MTQITDQTSGMACGLPKTPIRVLAGVAAHFVDTRPADPLFAEDLLVAVGAEAYILCGRSITGGSADLVVATLEILPVPYVGITRGEFALVLLREVNRSGEMWAEGDHARVIPRIPGQRVPISAPAPRQPTPQERSVVAVGVEA